MTPVLTLRANYFGLAMNAGLALFFGAVLLQAQHPALSAAMLPIALYQFLSLKRVTITPTAIKIIYPFRPALRTVSFSADDVLSYRFASGHYTEWDAILWEFDTSNGRKTLRTKYDASDWQALEQALPSWFPGKRKQ